VVRKFLVWFYLKTYNNSDLPGPQEDYLIEKSMPFPVEEKYINKTEEKLGVKFPKEFRDKMIQNNGGEFESLIDGFEDHWTLFPFLDESNNKRVKRTCNDIILENKGAKGWSSFPAEVIAIANNGCGDYLVLKKAEGENLDEKIYYWNHEEGLLTPTEIKIRDLNN